MITTLLVVALVALLVFLWLLREPRLGFEPVAQETRRVLPDERVTEVIVFSHRDVFYRQDVGANVTIATAVEPPAH